MKDQQAKAEQHFHNLNFYQYPLKTAEPFEHAILHYHMLYNRRLLNADQ